MPSRNKCIPKCHLPPQQAGLKLLLFIDSKSKTHKTTKVRERPSKGDSCCRLFDGAESNFRRGVLWGHAQVQLCHSLPMQVRCTQSLLLEHPACSCCSHTHGACAGRKFKLRRYSKPVTFFLGCVCGLFVFVCLFCLVLSLLLHF